MHCRLPLIATGLWGVCTEHDGLQKVEKNEKRNRQAKQKEIKKASKGHNSSSSTVSILRDEPDRGATELARTT
jgi:hypothetical protein